MFSRIGTSELLVILAIFLLIFGPKNLPKLGKAVSETINGFKAGHKEGSDAAAEEAKTASEDKTAL